MVSWSHTRLPAHLGLLAVSHCTRGRELLVKTLVFAHATVRRPIHDGEGHMLTQIAMRQLSL